MKANFDHHDGLSYKRFRNFCNEVDKAIRVTPLIVVPGVEFDLGIVDHHGGQCVNNRGAGIVQVIGGNQRFFLVTQDAFQFALRCLT